MSKRALMGLVALVGLGGLAMYSLAIGGTERADCPGRIVCPLTGDEICRDQCPLVDADRPDCPGKIDCPLTGELVCRDECPLVESTTGAGTIPACCQASN